MTITSVEINQIALVLFIIVNLFVGIWAAREGIATMKDYALAGRQLGGGTLTMTLIASLLTVWAIDILQAYHRGVIILLYPLSYSIMAMLLGWVVFPKLLSFKNCYTISDIMGRLYGTVGYLFTSAVAVVFSLLVIIAQLKTLGDLGGLVGLAPATLVLLLGIWMSLYTCWGGIRAVAMMDVIQFILMGVGFLALAVLSIKGLSDNTSVLDSRPHHLLFFSHPQFIGRLVNTCFWTIWPVFLISPPVIQRVLMANSKTQIRHMFLSFAWCYPVLRGLLVLIGFKLLFLSNGALTKDQLNLSYAIKLLTTHWMPQMLFFLAVCSVILSTANSFLNALTVLVVCDIANTQGYNKENGYLVSRARAVCLVLGLACTAAALYQTTTEITLYNLQDFVAIAYVLFTPLAIPFIAGVLGLQGNKTAFKALLLVFFISFPSLFITFVHKQIWLITFLGGIFRSSPYTYCAIAACVLSALISGAVFFIVHYIENGRFVVVQLEESQ